MKSQTPPTPSKPARTRPAAAKTVLDGSLTIADIAEMAPAQVSGMGKQAIKDIGRRYRQIVGLKPGSSSIRTRAMIEELMERLIMGESVSSILCDTDMPAPTTLWYWCRDDDKLDADIKWAQALGQRTLKDLEFDIASGGLFSTGDRARDELLIRVIDKNASQRARGEFGERIAVDQTVSVAPVVLPSIVFHDPPMIEDRSADGEE